MVLTTRGPAAMQRRLGFAFSLNRPRSLVRNSTASRLFADLTLQFVLGESSPGSKHVARVQLE